MFFSKFTYFVHVFVRKILFLPLEDEIHVFTVQYSLYCPTCPQLSSTKTTDNKSTLLHFLVSTIENKYPEALDVKNELGSVLIAAKGDSFFDPFNLELHLYPDCGRIPAHCLGPSPALTLH